jgi:hypothetical protein
MSGARKKECRPGRGRCRVRRELEITASINWVEGAWWMVNYPAQFDLVAIIVYCPWCGRPLGGKP